MDSVRGFSSEFTSQPFDKFQATNLWRSLINDFYATTQLVCGSVPEDDCLFTGAQAAANVQILLEKYAGHLNHGENGNSTTSKVEKLCHLLLSCGVFDAVTREHEFCFENSARAVYRLPTKVEFASRSFDSFLFSSFTSRSHESFHSEHSANTSNASSESQRFLSSFRAKFKRGTSALGTPVKQESSANGGASLQRLASVSQRSRSPISALGSIVLDVATVASPNPVKAASEANVEQFDVDVVRELAMFRLLTLIDLNVLDGILYLKDVSSMLSVFSTKRDSQLYLPATRLSELPNDMTADTWLYAAASCITFTPEVLADLRSVQDLCSRQLHAFHKVVDVHSKRADAPYIPAAYANIVQQVYSLLAARKDDLVVEACQLLLLLLSVEARRCVRALLNFMRICSEYQCPRVERDLSNLDACLNAFSSAILPNVPSTTRQQQHHLLAFMVCHALLLHDVPVDLKTELNARSTRQAYTVAEPKPLVQFCNHISTQEYEQQGGDCTELQLMQLANGVIDNTRMTLQDKQQWLANFKHCYPALYGRHFSDIQW